MTASINIFEGYKGIAIASPMGLMNIEVFKFLFEEELNAARIELCEAAKDITAAERNKYFRIKAAPVNEEFGIKPCTRSQRVRFNSNFGKFKNNPERIY
jgi:hypothetical protein